MNEDDDDESEELLDTYLPLNLPQRTLTGRQKRERIGLKASLVPAEVKARITAFKAWCTNPIQLDRMGRYARPVQSTTIPGNLEYIRFFLGFAIKYHSIPVTKVSLRLYQNGSLYADFVAYLLARGGGLRHLAKHLSLARKINYFLASTTTYEPIWEHAETVDEWLWALGAQLNVVLPKPERAYVPQWATVAEWADDLAEQAINDCNMEREARGSISRSTARRIHDALIVCLVVGIAVPPLRLGILKSLALIEHADENGCMDPDCRHPGACLGNRILQIKVPRDADSGEHVGEG
jgi:hypothetical protein